LYSDTIIPSFHSAGTLLTGQMRLILYASLEADKWRY